jgi:hypothetical protein
MKERHHTSYAGHGYSFFLVEQVCATAQDRSGPDGYKGLNKLAFAQCRWKE